MPEGWMLFTWIFELRVVLRILCSCHSLSMQCEMDKYCPIFKSSSAISRQSVTSICFSIFLCTYCSDYRVSSIHFDSFSRFSLVKEKNILNCLYYDTRNNFLLMRSVSYYTSTMLKCIYNYTVNREILVLIYFFLSF